MTITATIPAHDFEPAKRANPNGSGLIDDPKCGYLHRIESPASLGLADGDALFCTFTADYRIHHGDDVAVFIRDQEDQD